MQTAIAPHDGVGSVDAAAHPLARPSFEWSVLAAASALVAGTYLDGWAHIHELPETFFTPWHGVIYGSLAAVALILFNQWRVGRRAGHSLRKAMPAGYGLALVGVLTFVFAGGADFAWHSLFGIENDIEALYSPPHVVLATGAALVATAPLRAASLQGRPNRASRWRAVLSATLLLAILSFFTSEMHPFVHPWASAPFKPSFVAPSGLGLPPAPSGGVATTEIVQTLGLVSFVLQALVVVAITLFLIRRWGSTLPAGWLTAFLGLPTLGLSFFHSTPWTVPVALLAGFAGELLFRRLHPSTAAPRALRIFSATLPVLLFSFYFAALFVLDGTWWSVHMWVGAIVLSGIAGWLVSYLAVPPVAPHPDAQVAAE